MYTLYAPTPLFANGSPVIWLTAADVVNIMILRDSRRRPPIGYDRTIKIDEFVFYLFEFKWFSSTTMYDNRFADSFR